MPSSTGSNGRLIVKYTYFSLLFIVENKEKEATRDMFLALMLFALGPMLLFLVPPAVIAANRVLLAALLHL